MKWLQNYQKGGSTRGTKLSESQEKKYQQWRKSLPTNLQYEGDYDLRGFYRTNPNWSPSTPGAHMTDRYKLPNHPTFSNESIYFNASNRDSAGYWQDGMYIPYNPAIKDTIREYKKGGYIPDYADGTKYPQVGPRDWMNDHGWYAKEGGTYTQWDDIDPVANAANPSYTDYGNMYAADPRFGLFYKPESTAMWGMGNNANLMKTDYSGFSGRANAAPIPQPQVQTPRAKVNKRSFYEQSPANDYSVDAVRKSYKEGGSTKKQNVESLSRMEALHIKYPTADRKVFGDEYQDNIGPYIERTEGLTPQGFANLISGRYGEDIGNFYNSQPIQNNYQINPKTLSPVVPEQYRDYSYLNKPQFDYIQGSQKEDGVYKEGGKITKGWLNNY